MPSSRGGSNDDCNKTHLTEKEHEAYHVLGANMEPAEVAMHILMVNRKSFNNEWFVKALKILSEGREAMYKPEAFIESMRWQTREEVEETLRS